MACAALHQQVSCHVALSSPHCICTLCSAAELSKLEKSGDSAAIKNPLHAAAHMVHKHQTMFNFEDAQSAWQYYQICFVSQKHLRVTPTVILWAVLQRVIELTAVWQVSLAQQQQTAQACCLATASFQSHSGLSPCPSHWPACLLPGPLVQQGLPFGAEVSLWVWTLLDY